MHLDRRRECRGDRLTARASCCRDARSCHTSRQASTRGVSRLGRALHPVQTRCAAVRAPCGAMQEGAARAAVNEAVGRSRACFAQQSRKWAADEAQARAPPASPRSAASEARARHNSGTWRRSGRATLRCSSRLKHALPPLARWLQRASQRPSRAPLTTPAQAARTTRRRLP